MGHGLPVIAYRMMGDSAFAKPRGLIPVCASVILGTLLAKRRYDTHSETALRKLFQGMLLRLTIKLGYDGLTGLWN